MSDVVDCYQYKWCSPCVRDPCYWLIFNNFTEGCSPKLAGVPNVKAWFVGPGSCPGNVQCFDTVWDGEDFASLFGGGAVGSVLGFVLSLMVFRKLFGRIQLLNEPGSCLGRMLMWILRVCIMTEPDGEDEGGLIDGDADIFQDANNEGFNNEGQEGQEQGALARARRDNQQLAEMLQNQQEEVARIAQALRQRDQRLLEVEQALQQYDRAQHSLLSEPSGRSGAIAHVAVQIGSTDQIAAAAAGNEGDVIVSMQGDELATSSGQADNDDARDTSAESSVLTSPAGLDQRANDNTTADPFGGASSSTGSSLRADSSASAAASEGSTLTIRSPSRLQRQIESSRRLSEGRPAHETPAHGSQQQEQARGVRQSAKKCLADMKELKKNKQL